MLSCGLAWLLPQVFCNSDVHNYPKSAALGTLGSASQRTTSRLNAARDRAASPGDYKLVHC